jgi:predicted house-cleaning noncanonical NTP pyrophosphatase (MazG superfamily)
MTRPVTITQPDGSTNTPILVENDDGEIEINADEQVKEYFRRKVMEAADEIIEAKVLEVLSDFQDTVVECINRAEIAEEKATAAYESLQNLVDAHGQWQEEEMQPLLDQIWEEGLSVELMVVGLMKHLGVAVEDIARLAREYAASSDHQGRYNQSIPDTAHSRAVASTKGIGARNPTSSLGDSAGYVKESYQGGSHRRGLLPGF